MNTYICEFELVEDRFLRYRTTQRSFVDAQAAFGSYCAKNHFKPLSLKKWRIAGSKEYINLTNNQTNNYANNTQ